MPATFSQRMNGSIRLSTTKRPSQSASRPPQDLTACEKQILQLIWDGLTSREIGRRLTISIKTVEAHRATIMKKVRVSNTAQLLKAAIQENLSQLG
jgi:DNA-binding NarL/FixJ family response regulator